jgi:hypothetical protein
MQIALVVFLLAALGGGVLAVRRLQNKSLPVGLAALHGALAVLGVVLLALDVVGGSGGLALAALGVFAVAALGGLFLVSFHARGRPLPVPVMFVHAIVAVVGAVLLLLAVVG